MAGKMLEEIGIGTAKGGISPQNAMACVISMTTPSNFGIKNLPWQFDNLVRRTVQASYQGAHGTLDES
jgi:hypothetical protein